MSDKPVECIACGGAGQVAVDRDGEDGPKMEWVPCGGCNGTGKQP